MTSDSPVPRRLRTPSWFDLRLLAGATLVLASVVIGAVVVGRADALHPVLAVDRDLAAGTVLTADDTHVVRVRIDDAGVRYLPGDAVVNGRMLLHPIGSGELVPASALGAADPAETTLTIPVEPQNAPDVERGQRIEIWVSTAFCQAVPVLIDITVQEVRKAGSGGLSAASAQSLVVRVSRSLAERVVTALSLDGAVLRVGVLTGAVPASAGTALDDLSGCRARVTG